MDIGIRVAEIMERNRREAKKITIAPHWYYTVEEAYKGKRFKAAKLLIPSNWYRVRLYAREIMSSLPHPD